MLSGLAKDAEDEVLLSSPDIGVGAIGAAAGDWIIDVKPSDAPLTGRNAENSLLKPVLDEGLASPLVFAPPSREMGRDMVVDCRDGVTEVLCASGDGRCLVKGAG